MKRILSVVSLLLILAVMLGIGVSDSRDTADEDAIGIGVIRGDIVRVRKAPSTSAEMVAVLRGALKVTVLAEENGYYRIIAEIEGEEPVEGYMREELVDIKVYFHKKQ